MPCEECGSLTDGGEALCPACNDKTMTRCSACWQYYRVTHDDPEPCPACGAETWQPYYDPARDARPEYCQSEDPVCDVLIRPCLLGWRWIVQRRYSCEVMARGRPRATVDLAVEDARAFFSAYFFDPDNLEELQVNQQSPAVIKTRRVSAIRELITRSKDQIRAALPSHLTPDRMVRLALTAVQTGNGILECEDVSIVASIMQAAQLGLDPCGGILGEAYLVPYRHSKSGKTFCQLIVGYKGLIRLAQNSGKVNSVWAECVYAGDTFDVAYGLERKLVHVPCKPAERGEIVAAYAVARMADGSTQFKHLWREEIDTIRSRSPGRNSDAWQQWFDRMACKTAIRALCKLLPLSPEAAEVLDRSDSYEEHGAEALSSVEPRLILDAEPQIEPEPDHTLAEYVAEAERCGSVLEVRGVMQAATEAGLSSEELATLQSAAEARESAIKGQRGGKGQLFSEPQKAATGEGY